MNKPNWVCLNCGMRSSRKYSVQRHISNVHDGISTMVPFMEYVVGRLTGAIPPPRQVAQTVGSELKSSEPEKGRYPMTDEFFRSYSREMGKQGARKQIQGRLY